ncbi:MAG: alpha/beta hydrolase [Steroidobacteraceae bacterium]|jgi:pimeloyl-ACP methyl ester carboxylesterase|nr:alpha/beta hydrolase [Steroidobacteraceae bacterium]
MPYFRHDGVDLHYLERGRGRPVVLIHGLGMCGGDWAFHVPALETHYRVILPDLRGSGRSSRPRGRYSIPQFARDMWALLDHLGIDSADLVGFSLGGAVALEMSLQRPERVPRLVTINSLASYRPDHWRKWLEARVQTLLVRWGGMPRTARLVAARVFPEPWQAALRERAITVIGATPPRPYLATVAALERWSCVRRLGRLRTRTLIVAAEHDYTPLEEKRELAAQLGAEFVVVSGSRHGTPFDAIRATNACIGAFLQDAPLPAPEDCRLDTPEDVPREPPPGSVAQEHAAAAPPGAAEVAGASVPARAA